MAYKVSREKVDALLTYAREHVPDLEIIYKDEPLPTWWMKVIFALAALVGVFSPSFAKKWKTSISNAMGKKWMIFPTREGYEDLTRYGTYSIFRHELVHLLDSRRYGIWFFSSYVLFPLPSIFTNRAHWEFRGYAQNMIVRYEEFGVIEDSRLDWIASQFTGGLYFWMWPFKGYVRKKLEMLRQDIYSGKVDGYNPDITWWDTKGSLK